MIAESVMSFGYRVPAWVLVAGLAVLWLAGLWTVGRPGRSKA